MIDLSVARSLRDDPFSTSPIPTNPGIYVMYDHGHALALGRNVSPNINLTTIDYTKNVAYVGSSGDLRRRIRQHMIERNSSVVTGVSATLLNPDKVSHICWWCLSDAPDRASLEAVEIVAFGVFNPSLRSRATVSENAKAILEDRTFHEEMKQLFSKKPNGLYYPMTFDNLVYWTQKIDRRST